MTRMKEIFVQAMILPGIRMEKSILICPLAKRIAAFSIIILLCFSARVRGQAVTVESTPACAGSSVTFTATVTPNPLLGFVAFYDGSNAIGSAVAIDPLTGKAELIIPSAALGTYDLSARYGLLVGVYTSISVNVAIDVNPRPPTPTSPVDASRCGPGTLSLSATVPAGQTMDWYDAPTGGTLIASGLTFTTPSISAPTTYYAAARNTTTTCVSAGRLAVDARIDPIPAVAVAGAGPFSRCGPGTAYNHCNCRRG